MYTYSAYVTKVYDGDTVTVDIDLGFGVLLRKQRLRLLGINAPEVRGTSRTQGLASRDFLRKTQKTLNRQVFLQNRRKLGGNYRAKYCKINANDPATGAPK